MMDVRTVTVIGVTGTMGANVAGIFASFGNAKVYCLGRDIEKVRKTIPRIIKSVKADSIRKNLIPMDFSDIDKCVAESDLVFESSVEDINVKTEIAKMINSNLRQNAISCTGSSGLSITEIAKCYSPELRGNFFGVHMFNPPYSMPLCELISTEYTDVDLRQNLKEYLQRQLIRTVVEVKDSPAFLANRIGFQFINEALQYAERYKDNGGIDYIDAVLGSFTGRSMPPLVTSDFVGLDVHKAIVENLYTNTNDYANDTFIFPSFANKLVADYKLGKKTGEGLYKTIRYDNGLKRLAVLDINTGLYRDKIDYVFPFSEKMKNCISDGDYEDALKCLIDNHSQEAEICLQFLLKYIVYSMLSAREVGDSVSAADDVMATGFNWCPPLALYHALSSVTDVNKLIQDRLEGIVNVDLKEIIKEVPLSQYDYRVYFKSGR